MYVIGLTGGIGTGKTAVADLLRELGATVVDADKVGHEAYRPGADAWQAVVAAFGKEIVTEGDEINRKRLGAIVFGDPAELARLNSIMHPRMYRMMEERLDGLRSEGCRAAVVEAALLIEADWQPLTDEVWVVTATEEYAVSRTAARSGLSEEAVRARIASQMGQTERVLHADSVIENDGTPEDLRRKVSETWNRRVLARSEN